MASDKYCLSVTRLLDFEAREIVVTLLPAVPH